MPPPLDDPPPFKAHGPNHPREGREGDMYHCALPAAWGREEDEGGVLGGVGSVGAGSVGRGQAGGQRRCLSTGVGGGVRWGCAEGVRCF